MTVADAVRSLHDAATIKFDNVELVMQTAGFTFSQGNLAFANFVKMTGGALTTNTTSSFSLTTKGTMAIGESSELFQGTTPVKAVYNIKQVGEIPNYL